MNTYTFTQPDGHTVVGQLHPSIIPLMDGHRKGATHDNLELVSCMCNQRPVESGDTCHACGGMTVRTGTCHTCTNCGETGGCG